MKLDQIRALIEAATPGPWFINLTPGWYHIRAGADVIVQTAMIQDARLIEASRTLMPKLTEALAKISEMYCGCNIATRFVCWRCVALAALESDE